MISTKNTSLDSDQEIPRYFFKSTILHGGLESKNRALSIACYFGLAPWIWLTGANKKISFLRHHLFYSLSIFLLWVGWFLVSIILLFQCSIKNEYLIQWNANVGIIKAWDFLFYFWNIVQTPIAVILFAIWITGILDGLRGRGRRIPFLAKIASSRWLMSFSAFFVTLVEICILCLFYIGNRSAQIVNTSVEKADVYILYTVGGYYNVGDTLNTTYTPPRWLVATAFYPLWKAGTEKWGKTSVKVLPLSENSFKDAIGNGRFVFVASHGGDKPGSFTVSYTPYKALLPSDILPGEANPNLQFVYIAGCSTNDGAGANWQAVLSPAQVLSFSGMSFIDRHMQWIWFKSPQVIADMY